MVKLQLNTRHVTALRIGHAHWIESFFSRDAVQTLTSGGGVGERLGTFTVMLRIDSVFAPGPCQQTKSLFTQQ